VDQKELWLKRLVIFLGVLLVICFFIVAGTIAYRLSTGGEDEVAPVAAEPVVEAVTKPTIINAPALPANDLAIAIPEDRKVIGVTVDGPHWLLLLDGRGSQQIWIVNKADGVVLRKVQLVEVDD